MTGLSREPVVLVVAKAPVAGEAKTRLGEGIGHQAAAALAAAALLDTLDACEEAFPRGRRYVALTGDLDRAEHGDELLRRLTDWTVLRQRGDGFARRLANAHADVAAAADAPVVQVGMDTPQLTVPLLQEVADRLTTGTHDAVLGPASDGGWWVLGVVDGAQASVLAGVPMSSDETLAATESALRGAGLRVTRTDVLDDVDTAEDAERVAVRTAGRFGAAWRAITLTERSDR